MSNDPDTDLEPLQKLEDTLVEWLKTKGISFVQDPESTRQRIYRGFENEEVAQNIEDQSIPLPEGDTTLTNAPSEGAESSLIVLPCITVNCEKAEPIAPDFCGNYEVSVSIEIGSNSFDSTHADHRSRVNEVMLLIFKSDILDELKEFDDDFDCSKIVFEGISKRFAGSDAWVTEIQLLFRHYTPRLIPEE